MPINPKPKVAAQEGDQEDTRRQFFARLVASGAQLAAGLSLWPIGRNYSEVVPVTDAAGDLLPGKNEPAPVVEGSTSLSSCPVLVGSITTFTYDSSGWLVSVRRDVGANSDETSHSGMQPTVK